jgi:hypothetical protein
MKSTMFCTECGKPHPESAKFCRSCGAATGEEESKAPGVVRTEQPVAAALTQPLPAPPSDPSRKPVSDWVGYRRMSELQKFDMWFRIGYRSVSGVLLSFWFVTWLWIGFVPDLPPDEPFLRFLFSMAAYGLCQFAFYLCLLPARLAIRRKRPDRMLIFAYNALLGWTLVAWLLSLLRVATGKEPTSEGSSESQRGLPELGSFDELFDVGYKLMAGMAFLLFLPVYLKPNWLPNLFPDQTQLVYPLEVYRLTAFTLWGLFEIGLYLYLLPARLAIRRKRLNRMLIFAVDVLLGWTLVGWAVSLRWALKTENCVG